MGLIPAETLESIRARLNIAELVAEYVPGLQRAGRNMKGRCPFHQERTPSFIVSAERQTFHCFGCGEGGDAFTFVMKIENLSFSDAVEKLAERAGVRIERQEDLSADAKERLKLKALMDFASQWYHEALKTSPEADAARRYLASRKVSPKSVEEFRLGYAARGLVAAALKKGYSLEQLTRAGLAGKREDGSPRDYFFNRVLFPIFDAKGAVIAFGGRILGEGEPKYLNSPENPLFAKRTTLYGLSHAAQAIRKEQKAILMEGYMDVIAAHQHGIRTACAPLGTALTAEHAAQLSRFCRDVTVVFDADNAGLNAAIRGAGLLIAKDFVVRATTVSDGKDPDELLHEKGVSAFQDCLRKSVYLFEFQTQVLMARQSFPLTPEAKSAVAKEVLQTIETSPDDVMKAEWMHRLALQLGVPLDAIVGQRGKVAQALARRRPEPSAAPVPSRVIGADLNGQDEEVLLHMFKQPASSSLAAEEDFLSAGARAIWKALRALEPWSKDWSMKILDAVPPAEKALLPKLLVKADELAAEDAEVRLRAILARRRGQRRYTELERLLRDGKLTDAGLREEFNRLLAQLKGSAAKA